MDCIDSKQALAEERLAHEKDIGKERLRRLKEKHARQLADERHLHKLELLSLEKQRAEEKCQNELKSQHTMLVRSNSKPNAFLFFY